MKDLVEERLDNEGGIEWVRFAPVEYFDFLPEVVDGAVEGQVVFRPFFGWHIIGAIRGSVVFVEDEVDNKDGVMYQPKLNMVVARYTLYKDQALRALNSYPVIFLIKDNNGARLMIGNANEQIKKLKRKVALGANPNERNQVSMEFGAYDGMLNAAGHYSGNVGSDFKDVQI